MVRERIADPVILSLIGKWLKAGAMQDGVVIRSEEGTPQGGPISCVLANIYLHFALDLWFERKFKPQCRGEAQEVAARQRRDPASHGQRGRSLAPRHLEGDTSGERSADNRQALAIALRREQIFLVDAEEKKAGGRLEIDVARSRPAMTSTSGNRSCMIKTDCACFNLAAAATA